MPKNRNIILLHGWGANITKLQPLASSLKKLGWNIYTPEIPGFDAPVPQTTWTIKDYSNHIHKLAEKKFGKSKFFIFGHSFGGRIATHMALDYNNETSGLILCSTGGISRDNFIKRSVFYVLAKTGKILLSAKIISSYKKVLYKLAREHDYEKAQDVMKKIFINIISDDLKIIINKINCPILVLWGEKDKVTPPKDAKYIKSVNKNAKVVTFSETGHRLPYEKYEQIAKEVDKWATL